MTNLDDKDRALIAVLAENARLPVAALAKKLGLARTTVQARLDRLERQGVIAGYTLRLGDGALPGEIHATVLIAITPAAQGAVLTGLRKLTAVERVFTTAGRFDFCCQLRVATPLKLDEALDEIGEIDGVVTLESLIHLSTRIDRAL
ncbi:Lrp/AsnC family transcriptional regulator [Pseudoroseicyclus sp. CXY001]|uniref:Lrp/AsnC family transcriptional regulator n=1 Tax=Pseudoroseicyclus sp. CXY001 TaxID=3242492 RepID=UPI003570E93F